ncbi:hypothetical protein QQ73_02240, partial [Candidatus Endoriftia persephone str. Guaymas]|nr:hypothetical protein [Candidatus Endoriftia persephone str. Guaymas]
LECFPHIVLKVIIIKIIKQTHVGVIMHMSGYPHISQQVHDTPQILHRLLFIARYPLIDYMLIPIAICSVRR